MGVIKREVITSPGIYLKVLREIDPNVSEILPQELTDQPTTKIPVACTSKEATRGEIQG